MTRIIGAVFLSMGISGSAHAATVAETFCIDYALDYADEDSGELLDGDTANAKGALVRFHRMSDDALISGGYLAWNGSNPGCGLFLLDNTISYRVKVIREASVDGNILRVFDDSTTPAILSSTILENHTPINNAVVSDTIGPTASIRILAAASWAIARRNGGVAETFGFFTEAGCGGTSCEQWPEEGIFISSAHDDRKFTIVHELGHAVADASNGDEDANDDDAALNGCNASGPDNYGTGAHQFNSKEFASEAFVEGIAHFYAAVAFNSDEQFADCEIEKSQSIDWDADGTFEPLTEPSIFSCEFGVSSAGVNSTDYTGQFCLGSGGLTNRGTEYDVVRGLWDLVTDLQVSVATLYDIWDEANPDDWTINGTGSGGDFPAERLHDAAHDVGGSTLQGKWDNTASTNGMDR